MREKQKKKPMLTSTPLTSLFLFLSPLLLSSQPFHQTTQAPALHPSPRGPLLRRRQRRALRARARPGPACLSCCGRSGGQGQAAWRRRSFVLFVLFRAPALRPSFFLFAEKKRPRRRARPRRCCGSSQRHRQPLPRRSDARQGRRRRRGPGVLGGGCRAGPPPREEARRPDCFAFRPARVER